MFKSSHVSAKNVVCKNCKIVTPGSLTFLNKLGRKLYSSTGFKLQIPSEHKSSQNGHYCQPALIFRMEIMISTWIRATCLYDLLLGYTATGVHPPAMECAGLTLASPWIGDWMAQDGGSQVLLSPNTLNGETLNQHKKVIQLMPSIPL